MLTKPTIQVKPPPKTRADLIRERGEQIGWEAEQRARRQAEQAVIDEGRAAFQRRVQAARAGHASAVARLEGMVEEGKLTPEIALQIQQQANDEAFAEARASIQGLDAYFAEDTARVMAEAEEAERQRLAAISPHDAWVMSLDYPEQQKVKRFEAVSGLVHPLAPH